MYGTERRAIERFEEPVEATRKIGYVVDQFPGITSIKGRYQRTIDMQRD